MKLRNKKTGEVKKMWKDNICLSFSDCNKVYYSLTELNEEWEDYKPADPLIKNKKIRKAVRLWAEANGTLEDIKVHSLTTGTRFSIENYDIEFLGYFIYELEGNKTYTIDELCGEEEE